MLAVACCVRGEPKLSFSGTTWHYWQRCGTKDDGGGSWLASGHTLGFSGTFPARLAVMLLFASGPLARPRRASCREKGIHFFLVFVAGAKARERQQNSQGQHPRSIGRRWDRRAAIGAKNTQPTEPQRQDKKHTAYPWQHLEATPARRGRRRRPVEGATPWAPGSARPTMRKRTMIKGAACEESPASEGF